MVKARFTQALPRPHQLGRNHAGGSTVMFMHISTQKERTCCSSVAWCAPAEKRPRWMPDCMLYLSIRPLAVPTTPKLPHALTATAAAAAGTVPSRRCLFGRNNSWSASLRTDPQLHAFALQTSYHAHSHTNCTWGSSVNSDAGCAVCILSCINPGGIPGQQKHSEGCGRRNVAPVACRLPCE